MKTSITGSEWGQIVEDYKTMGYKKVCRKWHISRDRLLAKVRAAGIAPRAMGKHPKIVLDHGETVDDAHRHYPRLSTTQLAKRYRTSTAAILVALRNAGEDPSLNLGVGKRPVVCELDGVEYRFCDFCGEWHPASVEFWYKNVNPNGYTVFSCRERVRFNGRKQRTRGMESSRHLPGTTIDAIRKMRESGMSAHDISRAVNLQYYTVREFLIADGHHVSHSARGRRDADAAMGSRTYNGIIYIAKNRLDDALLVLANAMAPKAHYITAHRLLAAVSIGRPLTRDERVRFLDGNRGNLHVDNIDVVEKNSGERIYFLQYGDAAVKIGSTIDLASRVTSLANVSPLKLTLLATIDAAPGGERLLHDYFSNCAVNESAGREFFRIEPVRDWLGSVGLI